MDWKKLLTSRTVWLGLLTIAAAGADALASGAGWRQIVVAIIGTAIIILRTKTTEAITK